MVISISKFVESVSNIIKCGKPEIQMLHNPNLKMVNNMKPQIKKKEKKIDIVKLATAEDSPLQSESHPMPMSCWSLSR
ncbi:hypothetical protein QL285_082660 [Trifolium repens]|nr:hypothetical protein QL285_082660 [Trifolium repens]